LKSDDQVIVWDRGASRPQTRRERAVFLTISPIPGSRFALIAGETPAVQQSLDRFNPRFRLMHHPHFHFWTSFLHRW